MLNNLSEKLDKAIHLLKGHGRITEINVAETIKEIRRTLIDADVNYKLAKDFTDKVKQKALGMNVLNTLKPGQLLTKVLRDELVELMGSKSASLDLDKNLGIILMVGLQGSGKTTMSAKLAHFLLTSKGKNPLLVACDVYRPAAIDQLHVLGEQIGVTVYSDKTEADPIKIAQAGLDFAKQHNHNTVIIDTAGRLSIDEKLMAEIGDIHKKVSPHETLFVVDAMTGQDAVNTAKAFNEVLDYQGVVLTKMDGDTRGGAALSIKNVVNKPIKFIGTGEKVEALDVFHPDRMADRILGMGDVVTLVEKAQQQFDLEEAKKLNRKFAKNQFGLDDFLDQIQKVKKMGNMKDLMGMLPGMNKIKDLDIDDDVFKLTESIIKSMTPKERSFPKIIDQSRKKRIANGSGTSVEEVNKLLKQFGQMSKLMKLMKNSKNIPNLSNIVGGRL